MAASMTRTACKPGCHWCCHGIPVMVREIEARRVWDACDQDRVKGKLRGFNVRAFDPCPLLVRRKCSVHDVRPASCRGFNSTSRGVCKRAYIARDNNAPIPVEMSQFTHWESVRQSFPGPDRPLVDWLREFANG